MTPRFLVYCRSCGFALWPTRAAAGAAFSAWQQADPARAVARPYDFEVPVPPPSDVIDYEDRAHHLGIHIFPSSSYPFVICIGFLFLGLAAVPFPSVARIVLLVVGLVIFLIGVIGWVVLEDFRMYPAGDVVSHDGGSAEGHEVAGQPAEEQRH